MALHACHPSIRQRGEKGAFKGILSYTVTSKLGMELGMAVAHTWHSEAETGGSRL